MGHVRFCKAQQQSDPAHPTVGVEKEQNIKFQDLNLQHKMTAPHISASSYMRAVKTVCCEELLQ